MEPSETQKSHLNTKKRRLHVPTTSTSHNEILEMGQGPCQRSVLTVEVRQELNSKSRQQDPTTQGVNFEVWNPNYDPLDSQQQGTPGDAEADMTESTGTLARFQRLVGVKKGPQIGLDDGKTDSSGNLAESVFNHNSPVINCIGLGKKTVKKTSEALLLPKQQTKVIVGKAGEGPLSIALHEHHLVPTEVPPLWDIPCHTCHQPPGESWHYDFDFPLPRATAWDHFENLAQELESKETPSEFSPQRIIRSITDLDISEYTRSTSFGRFDTFRQSPPVKQEENGGALSADEEQVDSGAHTRSGGIGKKMKNISLTMRKRIVRNYAKALSEELGDETEKVGEEGNVVDRVRSFPEVLRKSSYSMESVYSLNSGQSSSSGVTSGSDSSQRDSLRLDEELSLTNTGQICGRAQVHTDFVPSPYDTESLKLKVGDVIEIISKPPMGTWTGVLNNKVGNFKFIYVDLIEEKVPEPPQKMRTHRRSRRPQAKTVQELLERLHLEEYGSSLLLNGYQTVDDLRELKEQHLVELNVTDPEHRLRLMAAVECIHDVECIQEPQSNIKVAENHEDKSPVESIKVDLSDCPRDSGCYISQGCYSPDCTDKNKDETNTSLPVPDHHPPMGST
ncbi:SAM domain-containing protein SAMSN-1b isoform X2 [Esox lucius]|uniref:SAM domain, SH3 domain and nuclear localisation signals 1b n=1 Tax=Esox lucius TaxID=8010 RepID=A0A3P8ZAU9_ESOLU|nr:SAM domain-containing protein SAMSN-1b isoform X2 [Esox lucius]